MTGARVLFGVWYVLTVLLLVAAYKVHRWKP